ncbi:MAG TPA: hypothetical protein VG166_07425 [Caulobacteraceae bacterium]|jgi:hypothetical protein|nr:hypothetical protein [Caulobacteraceae bacterium]
MSDNHWIDPVSGDFAIAANWTRDRVPGIRDTAILDAPGTVDYTVALATSTSRTVGAIETAATARLDITAGLFYAKGGTGAGANAGVIAIENGAGFRITGGFDNTGSVILAATNQPTHLVIEGSASLTGGGQVLLGSSVRNHIYALPFGLLTNVDNTISGAGWLMANIDNLAQGVIAATASQTALKLSGSVTNAGLIEGQGAAGLRILGTVANAGGIIEAGNGSTVSIGGTIRGGIVETAGSGIILAAGGVIDGAAAAVINGGAILIGSGKSLTARGTIDNMGTISIMGKAATLDLGSATTFIGGGLIALGALDSSAIIATASGATLTNVDNTLSGAGSITASVINDAAGVIAATASQTALELSGSVANAGLIEGQGAAGVRILGTVANVGGIIKAENGSTVNIGGTIRGGTLETAGSGVILVAGGVLDGVAAPVVNDGAILIGAGKSLTTRGTIDNVDAISIFGGAAILDLGSATTFTGGGAIILGALNANAITATAGGATLTNFDNTLSGAGSITASVINDAAGVINATGALGVATSSDAGAITNAGLIEATAAGALSLLGTVRNSGTIQTTSAVSDVIVRALADGTGKLANSGVLEVNGGTMTLSTAVTGAGDAVIASGRLFCRSSFSEDVTFTGAPVSGSQISTLSLDQSQGYAATIVGFFAGAELILGDIDFVSGGEATFAGDTTGGVLTVSDGTHTAKIHLAGDFTASVFTASADSEGLLITVRPQSAAVHWASAVSGNFTVGADWSGGVVPGMTDDAVLDAPGSMPYTVTASTSQTVDAIVTAADATLNITAYNANVGAFTVSNGTGTGVNAGLISIGEGQNGPAASAGFGGAIVNTGEILVYAGYESVNRLFFDGDASLTGGGTVLMDGFGNSQGFNHDDFIEGNPGGADLTNVDNTIVGGGFLFFDYMAFTNGTKGVIDSTDSVGLLLSLYASASAGKMITNAGLVEATAGGLLTIGPLTVDDSSTGVILASGGGSQVQIYSSTIEGGVLRTVNGGEIVVINAPAVFDGVDNAVSVLGNVTIGSGANLTLQGRVSLDGGNIVNDNPAAISSTGVVVGVGSGGSIQSALDNEGALVADGGTLTISGAVTGSGIARILAGTLDVARAFTQDVDFPGTTGELELGRSRGYTGTISGFSKTGATSLDLDDIAFISGTTKATFSGTTASGVLTVTDGTNTANIHLSGDYTSSTFAVSNEGHGGVLIVDPPLAAALPASASPQPLVHAMAGFTAPPAATHAPVTHGVFDRPLHLAGPRTQTA